jgi:hypothetical protein
MTCRMGSVVLEGTPEEIAAVLKALGVDGLTPTVPTPAPTPGPVIPYPVVPVTPYLPYTPYPYGTIWMGAVQ